MTFKIIEQFSQLCTFIDMNNSQSAISHLLNDLGKSEVYNSVWLKNDLAEFPILHNLVNGTLEICTQEGKH